MFDQTLYPKTKQVLELISKYNFLNEFYLAGGTALALQIGHRKSIDLDFFAPEVFDQVRILDELKELQPKVIQQSEGTLDLIINEVKVSFLKYSYPLLNGFVIHSKTKLASIEDISCMKLSAVSSRGAKKDFVDLYYILKKLSLEKLIQLFKEKYRGIDYSLMHLLKSLIYFSDAESEPNPDFLIETNWNEVKDYLSKEVDAFIV